MNNIGFRDITVDYAIRMCGGTYINGDILLIDEMANLPLPKEPRRMQCLLVGMCLKGSARYFVDAVEHVVGTGDIIIINQGRVTYDCTMTPDCRGIGVIIDYNFFKETIKSVHELSSLFLLHAIIPYSVCQQNVPTLYATPSSKLRQR